MKKILTGLLVLSMLAIVSCKKSTTVNGGSWTFKSTSYTVTSAIANSTNDNALVAISSSKNNYDELMFTFYTLPTASGSYTVVAGAPDTTGTQVAVSMILTTGSTYTGPTYAPTASVTAAVTVSNGLIKIAMPAVDMLNVKDTTGVDHGSVTANIMQTQATM